MPCTATCDSKAHQAALSVHARRLELAAAHRLAPLAAAHSRADPSFTPTCHSQVPGYIALADKFKQKGVDGIYVVSVNDMFVMNAWKKDLGGDAIEFSE